MKNYFQNNNYQKNIDSIQKSLDVDGFFVIRNFFKEDEIKKMNDICDDLSNNGTVAPLVIDLIRYDKIREFAFHDKLVSLMKLLIEDDLYYFGDSTIHFKPNQRIFHTDARPEGFVEKFKKLSNFSRNIFARSF